MSLPIWDTWVENKIQLSDKKIINELLTQLNEFLKIYDPVQYESGTCIYYNYDWRDLVGNIPRRLMSDRYLPEAWAYDPNFINICFYLSGRGPNEIIKFELLER